ncbi:MAG: hypothetical protein MJZ23_07745 [Paludibacteraceae bacterium]|nr:hypothetical protein [Paludibacteraceae bacterium]
MGKSESSKIEKAKQAVESLWGSINDFKETTATKENIRSVLKGDILHKNIIAGNTGLILFIMLLAFVYVGIRYYVEDDIKEISRLQKELKEVRIESITRSSELMEISKRSTVVKTVRSKGLGLTESTEPPTLIKK